MAPYQENVSGFGPTSRGGGGWGGVKDWTMSSKIRGSGVSRKSEKNQKLWGGTKRKKKNHNGGLEAPAKASEPGFS